MMREMTPLNIGLQLLSARLNGNRRHGLGCIKTSPTQNVARKKEQDIEARLGRNCRITSAPPISRAPGKMSWKRVSFLIFVRVAVCGHPLELSCTATASVLFAWKQYQWSNGYLTARVPVFPSRRGGRWRVVSLFQGQPLEYH